MKTVISVFLVCFILVIGSCCAQMSNLSINKRKDSLANSFDTVLSLSTINFMQIEPPVIIIGKKEGKWSLIKYQDNSSLLKSNSLQVKNNCEQCDDVFSKIISLDLLSLADEKDLKTPCKNVKDTIINGKTFTEITDFNLYDDLEIYTVKYRLKKKEGTFSYKNPFKALEVCPESIERKKMAEIIILMKGF